MLALWKKSYGQPRSILKGRDITLPTKVCLVKAMAFPSSHVWMWKLYHKKSWKPENWCFWTWFWRRLLRVPWTAKRLNQSILKEINLEYSLEDRESALISQRYGVPGFFIRLLYWNWCSYRLEMGVSVNLWIVVKNVKTLVVYDVQWETAMDSMKGKCALAAYSP